MAKTKTKKSRTGGTQAPSSEAGAGTPYDSQIAAESTLRFSPEQSALKQALMDALDARDSDIASAHSAAQGAIQTARQAAPQLGAATTDALGSIDAAISGVAPGSGAADDIARTRTRLAERLGLAKADLATRQTRASEGEQYAVNAANTRADHNRSTILNRLVALGTEMGAFSQGRASELQGADADRQAADQRATDQNTTTLMAAGVDPATGEILAGGPKDPAANGDAAKQAHKDAAARAKTLASPDDHQTAAQTIKQAQTVAAALKAAGLTRQEAGQVLLNGRAGSSGQPVYTETPTRTGGVTQDRVLNPDGTQQETGAVPEVKAVKPLWASIALDLAYDGGVSGANVKRLHNPHKRYSVRELGVPTQTQRSQAERDRSKAQTNTAVMQGATQSGTSALAGLLGGLGG